MGSTTLGSSWPLFRGMAARLIAMTFAVSALLGAAVSGPANAAPLGGPAAMAAATSADRIAGSDRFETAALISQQAFPDGSSRVFLANGMDYPDALSAAPIAAALDAPLLLTAPNTLPSVVVAELARLAPDQVVVVGGEGVVSPAVFSRLQQLGYAPVRAQGADRYSTSRDLITRFAGPNSTIYLATGRNYPDALAAAAAAGSEGAPVLLVDGSISALSAASLALIAARAVDSVFIAGGTSVVSTGIEQQLVGLGYTVKRLAGLDRYGTAVAINEHAFPTAQRAFVATGAGFADALAGAVYAGTEQAPLYSSSQVCLPANSRSDMLDRLQVEQVTLLGGEGVLGPRVSALIACSSIDDDRETSAGELTAALQQRMSSLPGQYSVSVRELGGREVSVSIRGTDMQEPASVMKIFVAYAVLDRIDRGQLTLGTRTRSGLTVQECLRVTIHISDNYCHWDLVALVGQQAMNNQFWAEGYTGTVYSGFSGNGSYYSSKLTSTNDVALLLSRLEAGSLLSPELTRHFKGLLETQVWRHRLPAAMPYGIPIANKTGYLWVSSGYIHADVAIIDAPQGPLVVAIIGSRNATAEGVRALGGIAYEHFNGPVTTPALYADANLITNRSIAYYRYAGNIQLGVLPAGTRVSAYASARDWYQVGYGGGYIYVHSSALSNYYAYPRSE